MVTERNQITITEGCVENADSHPLLIRIHAWLTLKFISMNIKRNNIIYNEYRIEFISYIKEENDYAT